MSLAIWSMRSARVDALMGRAGVPLLLAPLGCRRIGPVELGLDVSAIDGSDGGGGGRDEGRLEVEAETGRS